VTRKLAHVDVVLNLRNGMHRVRESARRDGAGASGLGALLELSFVNAAGDALITVALAGSLFFSVSPDEARSKVALYLLITMAPFAVLAPVVGPMLDRVPHGRRIALAAVCLGRAMLAWSLAGALSGLQVYPLALGLLVLSKAFGVARSAAVPRVSPAGMTLVKVNSRLSLVNVAAGSILAPLGLAIAKIPYVGYPWVLRFASAVFLVAVLLAFRLPQHVDSAEGERRVRDLPAVTAGDDAAGETRAGMRERLARALGSLPVAVRTASVLRGLVGFLTFYLAFLLRTAGGTNLWLGGLAMAAAVGSGLGVFVGGRLGRRKPEALLMISLLAAAGGCVGAAMNYTKATSLLAVLLATMAGSMGKLGLDAVIQRDIPEDTRTSAFARSETALQLAWVVGGALGLISMGGTLGFSLASTVLMVTLFVEIVTLRRTRMSRLAARAAVGARGSARGEAPTLVDPDMTTADFTVREIGRELRQAVTAHEAPVDPGAATEPSPDTPTDPLAAGRARRWRRGPAI
jgi:MFS family permease